jgi:hypothetical protein
VPLVDEAEALVDLIELALYPRVPSALPPVEG